jgi:hypothetical protein
MRRHDRDVTFARSEGVRPPSSRPPLFHPLTLGLRHGDCEGQGPSSPPFRKVHAMSSPSHLVIISHYASRPRDDLLSLLGEVLSVTPHVLVAINDDAAMSPQRTLLLGSVNAIVLPNEGMNIGAWRRGYEMAGVYDTYIFLQDECTVLSGSFVHAYVNGLSDPATGMIGEAFNPKWLRTWDEIRDSELNYELDPTEYGDTRRVDYYLACMRRWGIDPGPTGRHLQSLVWAFNRSGLDAIGGFPLGRQKEECIAAEIAVTRAVEHRGLQAKQMGHRPFEYIHHKEWRRDASGKV